MKKIGIPSTNYKQKCKIMTIWLTFDLTICLFKSKILQKLAPNN